MGCPINLVLASSSPRRRQLLTEMGWSSFKIRPAELDETPLMGEKPEEMVFATRRE
jgi:Nucleotide-binding protein implicated in inhibition of septum formation